MRSLADLAALDADVGRLARALPALARALRYGDVRSTDTAALAEVATGLALRVCVGLPPACTGLDADGAAEMRGHSTPYTPRSGSSRTSAASAPGGAPPCAGSPRGTASPGPCAGGRPASSSTAGGFPRTTRRPPHGPRPVPRSATRRRGRVDRGLPRRGHRQGSTSGPVRRPPLVHDERLLRLVDSWLAGVPADAFTDVLPLLRRTFSTYDTGVRRTLGELVRRGPSAGGGRPALREGGAPEFGAGLDEARADGVLPVLRLLLGSGHDHREPVGAGR